MADSTFYAWSNFKHTNAEGKSFSAKPGDKVTAASLGVEQDEFDAYVESGAVRTTQYPSLPEGFTGSPREYAIAQIAAAAKGEDYNVALAAANQEPFVEPSTKAESK